MTTLAVDKVRDLKPGDINDLPVVASDIIYGGAAVGIVKASGHARPLTSADVFAGFAMLQTDNSSGAAAAKTVSIVRSGIVTIPVTDAVITDVGSLVYAQDDNAFSFLGTAGVFVGRAVRFVSTGIMDVMFDAGVMRDPFEGYVHESKAINTTVDAEDSGKVFWITADAVVITLPAVGGVNNLIVANGLSYGLALLEVAPVAADMIEAPNITAADDKSLLNTKATAQRGDYIEIMDGDANGWTARIRGTWAREA